MDDTKVSIRRIQDLWSGKSKNFGGQFTGIAAMKHALRLELGLDVSTSKIRKALHSLENYKIFMQRPTRHDTRRYVPGMKRFPVRIHNSCRRRSFLSQLLDFIEIFKLDLVRSLCYHKPQFVDWKPSFSSKLQCIMASRSGIYASVQRLYWISPRD